jgi:hypothetical protein
MAKYTVRMYPIVQVPMRGIEAASQQDAIKKAQEQVDLYNLLGVDSEQRGFAYAEDLDGYLVDEEDDADYERSTWYDKNSAPRNMGDTMEVDCKLYNDLIADRKRLIDVMILAVKYLDHPDVQAIPFVVRASNVAKAMHEAINASGSSVNKNPGGN